MSKLPYTKRDLVRAIVAAQYHLACAEDEWEQVDVRYSADRGVYFAIHEQEDGGYTLEPKVDIDIDAEYISDLILEREEEIKSL